MKSKKQNIIWISSWFVLSVAIAILFQYLKQTKDGGYNWADSFPVWIGGAIKGSVSAIIFLVVDYVKLRKLTLNKVIKLLLREAFYYWLFFWFHPKYFIIGSDFSKKSHLH